MLTVSIKVANDRDKDVVTLKNGERFYFPAWLKNVEVAVRLWKEMEDTPREKITNEIFNGAKWAHVFLYKCGVQTQADYNGLVNEILPKLRLPPDSPMARRRCMKCGSMIWGRESLLTGIGGGCRRNRTRYARQIRATSGG